MSMKITNSKLQLLFRGGDELILSIVMFVEPGYVATPICLVQSAYVLLKEKANIPEG